MNLKEVRKELVKLQLAYSAYINGDGSHSVGVRTNDQAADIVIGWLIDSDMRIVVNNNDDEFARHLFELSGTHTSVNNSPIGAD